MTTDQNRVNDTSSLKYNLTTSIRSKKAAETLTELEFYLEELQVIEILDITLPGLKVLPVYQVFRKNHRSGYFNYGKGFDHIVAKVSGLMEAVEMAVMEYPDSDISVNPWQGKVDSENIRRAINSPRSESPVLRGSISGRFNQGLELLSGAIVTVPTEDLFFDCVNNRLKKQPSTNGLASGNTVEEANISAIHELVERHLIVQSPFGVELEPGGSFFRINEQLNVAINRMLAEQMTCRFFFLGSRAGIFVFKSEVTFPMDKEDEFGTSPGWGAHSDPIIAVNRSVAEAIQIISAHRAIRTGLTPATEMYGGSVVSVETQKSIGNKNQFRPMIRRNSLREVHSYQNDLKYIEWNEIMKLKKKNPEETDLESLIRRLREWGIHELVSVKLSSEHLPFTVVRCFSNEFNAPW